MTKLEEMFPNGFDNWRETYYEIVTILEFCLDHPISCPKSILNICDSQGRGGLYDIAKEYTDEFEKLYKGKDWDVDFFDTIDEFMDKKLIHNENSNS
jgi:hypothetical protein